MKFAAVWEHVAPMGSPPAREAWIEMFRLLEIDPQAQVASREGGVD